MLQKERDNDLLASYGCSKSHLKNDLWKKVTVFITKQQNEILKSKNTKSHKTKLLLDCGLIEHIIGYENSYLIQLKKDHR